MKNLSLRYRLSISYAVIALLTVLLLGGIMILILFNFYLDQEKEYLSQNAQEISYMFSSLVESQMPEELKQLLLENISFLSNAQVRILDTDRAVLFDTGLPEDITSLTFDPMGQGFGFIEGEEVSVTAPLNYSEEINPYQIYLEVTDFSTFPG